jgi:thiol:disulfide interchange protein
MTRRPRYKIIAMRGIFAATRPLLPKHATSALVLVLLLSTAVLVEGCKSGEESSGPSLTAPVSMPPLNRRIYSETANPTADIAAAIAQAGKENKRVILDFGGNWCGDCQVLDIYLQTSPNNDLLSRNFILVHVDIGRMDHNVEVAERYKVPIQKGVPALAVLDSSGKLLFSQENKEFENMSVVNAETITAFLNRWKS